MEKSIDKTYKALLEIRNKKDIKLNENPYLNPKYQLRYYQIIGMLHMYMVKRFILGDDCGIGKTVQIISVYASIKNKDPSIKMMVICPSSVMYQWASEIDKFCINITSKIVESKDIKYIDGEKLKSKDYLKGHSSRNYQFNEFENKNIDVVIFNYNTLSTDYDRIAELIKNNKFMVVFDECTSFKNTKSITHENARQLSAICDRVYGLSATIIKNDLIEAYSIFRVIMPYVFGTEDQFKKNYCIMEKKQLWKGKGKRGKVISVIKGYKNLDYFKNLIDPYYLGRKKSDVAKELPEIVSKKIVFNLNDKQNQLYEDALKGFIDFDKFNLEKVRNLFDESEMSEESNEIKLIDKLTALIYCQQIVNSPKAMGIAAESAKEDELIRMMRDELLSEKVVIYTRFRKMVDRIEELLTSLLGLNVLKITGEISNQDREDYKIKFNTSSDYNVMLINSAAKEGINLQSSGYLIFYDLPFSYGDFLQIVGRIHRIGSSHEKIFLLYMIGSGTVDEKVYDVLSNKKEIFDQILGDSAVGAIQNNDKNEIISNIFDLIIKEAKK